MFLTKNRHQGGLCAPTQHANRGGSSFGESRLSEPSQATSTKTCSVLRTYRDWTGLTQAVHPPDSLFLQCQVEQLEGKQKTQDATV